MSQSGEYRFELIPPETDPTALHRVGRDCPCGPVLKGEINEHRQLSQAAEVFERSGADAVQWDDPGERDE